MRVHVPEEEENLSGLNNLGLDRVTNDFSDSPFADREVEPAEIDALNDDIPDE